MKEFKDPANEGVAITLCLAGDSKKFYILYKL